MEPRHKARILAFKALYSWELNKTTTFTDITDIEQEKAITTIHSEFGESIFLGVLDNIECIDDLIKDNLNNWKIERISKVDLSILRLSLYSLLYINDVPRVITIDEAINLSKEFGADSSYKFINGILDSIDIK